MCACGPETERLEQLLGDLCLMDLGEAEGKQPLRSEPREQLSQARSAVFDEHARRQNFCGPGVRPVQHVGLDSLLGSDRDAGKLVLSCRQSLDRSLPAHLWISLSKETI